MCLSKGVIMTSPSLKGEMTNEKQRIKNEKVNTLCVAIYFSFFAIRSMLRPIK